MAGRLTGITSPDTGKEIVSQFHYNGYNSIVFASPYEQSFGDEDVRELKLLAKDFEVYTLKINHLFRICIHLGCIIGAHKRSSDLNYWIGLIKKLKIRLDELNYVFYGS